MMLDDHGNAVMQKVKETVDLTTACKALAAAKGIAPGAQLYGEDGGNYAISLSGGSPGSGWTLTSCPA